MEAKITFVDENDKVIGAGSKQEAWSKGIMHRIVRIFVFNSKGEILIQKRSDKMDLAPSLWDQAAGGHVDEGESYIEATARETKEELGIENVEFVELIKFNSDEGDNDKILKRFNILYKTVYDGDINFNEEEVSDIKWIKKKKLDKWIQDWPQDFTKGFLQTYKIYNDKIIKKQKEVKKQKYQITKFDRIIMYSNIIAFVLLFLFTKSSLKNIESGFGAIFIGVGILLTAIFIALVIIAIDYIVIMTRRARKKGKKTWKALLKYSLFAAIGGSMIFWLILSILAL